MLYIHIDYSLFLFYFYVLLYRLRFVNFIINEHDDDDDDGSKALVISENAK